MGRSSQRKGANGEKELAGILQQYGYQVERGGSETYGTIPDLIGIPGVHIECKRVERLNVPEAMKQAIRDAERFRDGAPAVFHRRNRECWLVTMRLEDWIVLLDKYGARNIKEFARSTADKAFEAWGEKPQEEPQADSGEITETFLKAWDVSEE